jgi:hypothetical protein
MKATLTLTLLTLALTSCSARGAKMNLHYTVTTSAGGIVQKFDLEDGRATSFAFVRSEGRSREGRMAVSAAEQAALGKLLERAGSYTCPPVQAADNQTITIRSGTRTIRCTEAAMDENASVDALIQMIRRLLARAMK